MNVAFPEGKKKALTFKMLHFYFQSCFHTRKYLKFKDIQVQ